MKNNEIKAEQLKDVNGGTTDQDVILLRRRLELLQRRQNQRLPLNNQMIQERILAQRMLAQDANRRILAQGADGNELQ